jgi:hypothetical protein
MQLKEQSKSKNNSKSKSNGNGKSNGKESGASRWGVGREGKPAVEGASMQSQEEGSARRKRAARGT